jgi:RNA polymerase sigma-70 factor (ECF subfamily)
MTKATLNSLAASFQEGDLECFRRIVELMTRDLIARAYSYLQDWETATDLTQETWLSVFESITRYDRTRPFKTWLFMIHRNRCLDHIRRASTRLELVGFDEQITPQADESRMNNPEAAAERAEYMAHIRNAFNTLPDTQRRVFALVDIEQEPQENAAVILNMKPSTLRSTLHFARKRMAQLLSSMEVTP